MTKKPPFIRSPYNYDLDEASDQSGYKETMPSLTVQSQTIDTDINEIMRRVGVGAPLPQNVRIPTYGDFTNITDYRSALHAIGEAQAAFLELPAATRAAFDNDPQKLLEAFHTPGNEKRFVELGLLDAKVLETTPENPNATPPTPAPPTDKK